MIFIVIQMECHDCGYQAKPSYYTVSDDGKVRYTLNCSNCKHMHTFELLYDDGSMVDRIVSALQVAGYELIPF